MESALKILQFTRPGATIELSQGTEKEIGLLKVINKLNFVNFKEGSIFINFRHAKYARTITLEASPLPCLDQRLECQWIDTAGRQRNLKDCLFENIFIMDGQKLVVSVPELVTLGEKQVVFLLPERSVEVNYRRVRRHACEEVRVELLQSGARFEGSLLDFSPLSFRVVTESSPTQTFHWVNTEAPVHVIFSRGAATIYSGPCRIISQSDGARSRTFILEPTQTSMQRFRPKEIRSARCELLPLPNAIFRHPLTGKTVDLKVKDISGSGFSVHEDPEISVLMPGLVIPEVELRIGNGFSTTCSAQVVYRLPEQEAGGHESVKCGMSFLDMEITDHVNLLALLSLAKDKSSYISNQVDADQLWQFFFETGFIYPEKYSFVQANKQKLKDMYETLYTRTPGIARHFIYQEKGVILGHLAMLRFYENSWLVHHHAANKSDSSHAGLIVLSQLAHSINDSHNLRSAHMNYIICYYRPDNRFPQRVFGTAAKIINDPKGCSIDTFAYLHYRRTFAPEWDFAGPWQLTRASAEDLFELESFYQQEAGGLMLQALELQPDTAQSDELAAEYRQLGLNLKRHLYALKRSGELKAVVAVNVSDAGLNLSDLTNCIQLLVVDQEQFPKEIAYLMFSILAHKYEQTEIPVLVYPVRYAEEAGIAFDKKYSLWAIDAQQKAPHFLKYLGGLLTRHRNKKEQETG